jgi:hypothetical protein
VIDKLKYQNTSVLRVFRYQTALRSLVPNSSFWCVQRSTIASTVKNALVLVYTIGMIHAAEFLSDVIQAPSTIGVKIAGRAPRCEFYENGKGNGTNGPMNQNKDSTNRTRKSKPQFNRYLERNNEQSFKRQCWSPNS